VVGNGSRLLIKGSKMIPKTLGNYSAIASGYSTGMKGHNHDAIFARYMVMLGVFKKGVITKPELAEWMGVDESYIDLALENENGCPAYLDMRILGFSYDENGDSIDEELVFLEDEIGFDLYHVARFIESISCIVD